MNAKGSLMAGALTPGGDGEKAGRAGAGLTVADMGNETSIGLFAALTRKTTGFELGIKVHRATIRSRAKHRARRENGNCFQNRYQGLRRLQPTRIKVNNL